MHRLKGFKKNIELSFIHFADAEAEAMWFSSHCKVHQQGSNVHCSAQQPSPGVTRAQGAAWLTREELALKMPALNNAFAFSSPKPLLCNRLKHTCQHTDGPPARVRGTGEGRHRVCAMAEPRTSTAPAKGAARQQPCRGTLTQDTTLSWPSGYQSKW